MPGFKADWQCCPEPFPRCMHARAGHFQSDHHPCPHPSCLERKFVVFAEEQDLKRHFAIEHGNETNMTRAQRRQVRAAATFCAFDPCSENKDARTQQLSCVLGPTHKHKFCQVSDYHVFWLHCDVCACLCVCLRVCLPVCRPWHSTSS